jgi:hypothetical protein
MSLANFFNKAALAASSILQGFDPVEFAKTLESHNVAVQFDDVACNTFEGQETLRLLINLLARLYPRVVFVPKGEMAGHYADEVCRIARNINPEIAIISSSEKCSICVVIGSELADVDCRAVYVGSDNWIVRISGKKPVGSGNSTNPFAAGAAACFGAANVFRALFSQQLNQAALDEEWTLSLLDFSLNSSPASNSQLEAVDLGETHLVGLGAIGNGTVWALSRVPNLKGKLVLVDEERVDLSNLQRYILTTQSDQEKLKVDLAREQFSPKEFLEIDPQSLSWGKYLAKRQNWNLNRVAVAVDTGEVRMAIQSSVPRRVLNAWTQPGNLGISRHDFLGEHACLMCLYLPDRPKKSLDELVMEAIGFTAESQFEVRHLLYTGIGLNRAFLERVASALHLDVLPLLRFEGKPLREFYTEAVCGGVLLSLGNTNSRKNVEVPMSFQSALGGILLAAEIVLDAAGLRKESLPTTTTIDLLKPLGSHLSFPHQKHPSGKCICQDRDFVARYEAKYVLRRHSK